MPLAAAADDDDKETASIFNVCKLFQPFKAALFFLSLTGRNSSFSSLYLYKNTQT
jgi:hypothetical protein